MTCGAKLSALAWTISRMMHTLDHWFDGVGRGATHVGTDPMRGVWFA